MKYDIYIKTLKKVPLFTNIDEVGIAQILGCCHAKVMQYEKDRVIARQGETYTGVGIIVEGSVIVSKLRPDGERVVISKFMKEKIFGEMIAFSHKNTWPADVIAMEATKVIYIQPKGIVKTCDKRCDSHQQFIQNMLGIVSNKALMLNKKVSYLSMKSMRGKIAMYLLEQAKESETYFDIEMNRNELADFLNVSRPSMSRELGRMKEEGIIDFHKYSFKILQMEKLKKSIIM